MSLISVVIPTYNRSEYIQRAVQSVLLQTYSDLEVIIIDDGSDDDTVPVVNELVRTDPRVRLIEHSLRKGAQAARNTGIRAAQGEWIAFLDSDDQWLPHSLEIRLKVAREEGSKVVHSECYVIREDGNVKPLGVRPMAGRIYRHVLAHPGPVFPALLVAKEALEKIGYLDEQIVSWQEWDAAIRLAKHYPFSFVAEPTFIYDCRGTDTISKNILRDALGYEQIVRKHILAILLHAGPRALARHYRLAASRYQRAGDQRAVQRCTLLALLWWPFRPRAILRQLGRVSSSRSEMRRLQL
jgi:glycosyltransferase involved in cell wall biosynthesis